MDKKELLPIGTVVLLKGAEKRLMIIGYAQKQIDENNNDVENNVWDYTSVVFPEGYITANQFFLFNHEKIDKVFHKGLLDDESNEFINKVNRLLSEVKSKKNEENVEKDNIKNNVNSMFDLNNN